MAASRLGSSLRDADLAGLGAPGLIGGVKAQAAGSSRELTKWQTALLVGVPLAAVAVAGAAILFYLRRRRRRRLVEEEVPVEDRSATPVPLGAPEGDAAEEPAAVGEAAGAEGEGGDATNRPVRLVTGGCLLELSFVGLARNRCWLISVHTRMDSSV